tara:strand:- start:488 stop:616 length:129 start_codon:yes stop_codon:yes gene_type:complete
MNEEEIIELTIMADVHLSCLRANRDETRWPSGWLNYVMGVDV